MQSLDVIVLWCCICCEDDVFCMFDNCAVRWKRSESPCAAPTWRETNHNTDKKTYTSKNQRRWHDWLRSKPSACTNDKYYIVWWGCFCLVFVPALEKSCSCITPTSHQQKGVLRNNEKPGWGNDSTNIFNEKMTWKKTNGRQYVAHERWGLPPHGCVSVFLIYIHPVFAVW